MRKGKMFVFLMLLGIVSSIAITNVSAAGWKSTLNLPYATIHTGSSRWYGTGTHRINISVDGFNTANGTVRKSGTTKMELALGDVATGQILKFDTATYTYATCMDRIMGSYSGGYRYYTFFSDIYNSTTGGRDYYDGVKSNEVYMYPLPD